MKKCKVCGKRFNLKAEDRYEVYKKQTIITSLVEAPTIFEAFDCPKCGCQNLVNIREGWKKEKTKDEEYSAEE